MSAGEFTYRTAAEETWRIFRIISEFVEGVEEMSKIGPAVSIFGSARTPPSDPYYMQTVELASKLSQRGLAIITGGGPGIMEAANKGAFEADGTSVGLNIALPEEQQPNRYQNVALDFHYFFARKVMFVKYASAFVCFPGGFGTMDEFFESMTLIQTGKADPIKVILIGGDFWGPLVGWIKNVMLKERACISPGDLDLFEVMDDIDEAVEKICRRPKAGGARRMTAEGTAYGVPPRESRKRRNQS